MAEETALVNSCGPDEECQQDADNLGANNTDVAAGENSSDDEEVAVVQVNTPSVDI